MPELPEAETIGRALQLVLPGRIILKVEIFSPAMREPLTPLADAGLPGRMFTAVRRRGRYLVADLDDGRALLMHFGMSGVVRVEPPGIPRRKHEHVFLHLSGDRIFKFECTRRFSLLKLCRPEGAGLWPPELDRLGIEPLSSEFDGPYLKRQAQRHRMPVKVFLMDNAVVTGIGNIYATETLFAAGIDPRREADSLTANECETLTAAARKILTRAIELGGSSISDFLNVDGSEGRFGQELKIYGREGRECPCCRTKLVSVKLGGRSSCFCPHCQK